MYHEAAKISGERFCVFYPFKNRFFLNPWVQLEFFRNCGSISKIVAPAFEMMMNSRVAWLKQIVISRWVICVFQKLWLHFKNCGSISKIVAPAFEMMMNSRVASVKQIVKCRSHNFWNGATISEKRHTPRKKGLPDPPKKWKWGPPKKSFPESTMACTFCKKPGPIWYILASGASFLIYTPPIGGHHPVLYFPSQIQRNIVQRCANYDQSTIVL